MSQETITSAESSAILPTDTWCTGVLPDQPANEVARCILEARLRAVWFRLPLAAEKSTEDVEHVHQLRVATRRAVESVRLFSTLIPDEVCRDVRATLRQIRLAADQARNWDVLSDMFLHCPDVSGAGVVCTIVEEIARRRRAAQQPLVAMAFEPSFRKELYPQVSRLQDILGIVNDHAMGKVFFHDWSLRAHDAQEKAFLEGLVLAEARAQRHVQQAFSALWTSKSLAELLRQCNLHCGLS